MMQTVYCECGESSMLNGRCTGCSRVRPSSKEVQTQISKLEEDIDSLLQELHRAQKLEQEDKMNAPQTIEG